VEVAVSEDRANEKLVRHFRQILLWPLQVMPIREGAQVQKHWEVLEQGGQGHPWARLLDELDDPARFTERHYSEFVTFLPYVQRFLYGEGRATSGGRGASPVRVFRRSDVAGVRITPREGQAPISLSVDHVDLYFFFDIDVVLLAVEIFGEDLALQEVQDILYRFGRAYPAGWDDHGQGLHCMHLTEWLGADGRVLVASDLQARGTYLDFVKTHRVPRIASHWAFLLRPLVLDHAEEPGAIRYRQLEYHRLPTMAYLAMDDPRALSRADFVRLGLVTAAGDGDHLPYNERYVADFERRYCFDRHWNTSDGTNSRVMCSGHALVLVGEATSPRFTDPERGALARFQHQYFLLFLIAHFQKASLLMFSDRLVNALNSMEVHNPESVKRFKRAIRQTFEIFLRFMHRYWFHDVSDEAQAKALFQMTAAHLGSNALFEEVQDEIGEMSQYLDSDSLRRQANTVVRLTVVTTVGLIGTLTTGLLGVNLIAAADSPPVTKLLFVILSVIPMAWLTLYSVLKSKRLSDFLETLSDERVSNRAKLGALRDVWRTRHQSRRSG
jgi:hypothetical protein